MGRRDVGAAVALLLMVWAVYVPALRSGFYSDDYEWLGRMNPTLERSSYLFSVFYRDFNPVLHLSLLADWLVGGGGAVAYHAQSIVIHGLCAALLLLLCKARTGALGLAVVAAGLWALNVRVSETVIWPAARGHSLATLLVLAALLVLGRRERWSGPLALALFVLALLAKETALAAMALVPFFSPRPFKDRLLYGATAAIGGLFVAFNLVAKPDFHTSEAGLTVLALKVPFILLRPLGLGDYYDFGWPMFAAVLLAFVAAALALRRTMVLVGLCWVAVCTLPLIPLDKLSSRYLYMMSIGYSLALCGIAPWLGATLRTPSIRRTVAAAAIAGLALVAATDVLSIQREIGDYAVLARPYRACVEALGPELASVGHGETVVVLDVGPRDAFRRLGEEIAARGNMNKLIPYRAGAVDGLIALPDLLNTVRREPGWLGRAADPDDPGPRRFVVFDGSRAWTSYAPPVEGVPTERIFAAAWDRGDAYFRE